MTPPVGSFRIKLKFDLKKLCELCDSLHHMGLSLNVIVVRVSSFFSKDDMVQSCDNLKNQANEC